MKTVSALDERIREVYGKSSHLDGITNLAKYKETEPKILWILKEMNNKENEPMNQREFHIELQRHNNEKYPFWKDTYKRIIECSYGIIEYETNDNLDLKEKKNLWWLLHYNNIPFVNDDAQIGACYASVLDRIAIINVNKCSGGGSSTNPTEIKRKYCEPEVKDFLLNEQIKQINPDVIINCSSVWNLTEDLKNVYKMRPKRYCEEVFYNNEKLLIHNYHPNERKKGKESYYEDIMKYYKWWKKIKKV